jgi:hypothetical protein
MEFFDSEMDSKLPAIKDWKLVVGKQKMRPHKDATQTPLPSFPDRQNNQTDNPKTAAPTADSIKDAHSNKDDDSDTS